MLETVIKRDGSEVPFDSGKILAAITKASHAVSGEEMSNTDLLFITEKVCQKLEAENLSHVEEIQDVVEEMLIRYDFAKIAKAYIIYRSEHNKIRNSESHLMEIYDTLTNTASIEQDIKRENANIDGDTAMGTMLKYGSEGAKFYALNYIIPKDISDAHANGYCHIHDLDFFMLTETCCQIDLIKLFKNGFTTGHGFLREPNSIISYAALACIAIQANQNEMHGGQSVPHFDYSMAPGVSKTFTKEYKSAFSDFLYIKSGIDKVITLEEIKDFTPKMGHDNRPEYLPLEEAHTYAVSEALKRTDRLTYQAMEALVHNLNTMNSRAGAQVPFSSLNYGTDTSPEGRMVIKNLLLATQAGLGNGETSIFPVQVFKVKEGVNYNNDDANYDLFKLAMETSAKRLFPNFTFLDAPFNLQYYKSGDWNSEVATMGCRTRVIGNIHDKNKEVTCGRGNLSFTTINLPRLAIEAEGDTDKFFTSLDSMMDLVFRQLMHRFKIQSARKVRNYPFLMGNGIWLDSDKLDLDDTIGEVLKHGTLTVGFIGLAETLIALSGKHHGESEEAQKLGLQIIGHMRKRCDDEAEKTKLNFSLIATPAESLCLAGDTLVQTVDGNRPIKDIKVGDLVFTMNETTMKQEIDRVVKAGKTFESAKVMRITFDTGQSVVCTPNHPFAKRVVNQDAVTGRILSIDGSSERIEWIPAENLSVGDRIRSGYLHNHIVTKIEYLEEEIPVYDITMEKNHNFFVGGDYGILVHNSGRFVALDKARYGVIPGVTDKEYYTNSFHIPVYYPIKAFRKIQLEAPYHALTNAGHITYVELDGDTSKNLDAFEAIIRYMHDQGIGYGSVNHPVDRDPVCGFTGIINDVCPRCGRREGEEVSLEKLKELRRQYPNMPRWA